MADSTSSDMESFCSSVCLRMSDFYPNSLSADDDSRGSPDVTWNQDGKVLPYQFEPEYQEEELNTEELNNDMRDSGNVDVGRLQDLSW